MDRFIEVKNVVKDFYGRGLLNRRKLSVRAVDRVSFSIDRNTVFGLVGESGCGKTTLVRSILYLDPPTSGEIRVDGTSLEALSSRQLRSFRQRMQIVFQDPNSALNPKMRIEDSLAEGLINRGFAAAERQRRIERLLDLVGIASTHRSRFPHEFSGGQKQRIVIARALCMEPDFLVLDEPVSNLDVSIQAQIINLLIDLQDEFNLSYIIISHDLAVVEYICDKIAVMYLGKIVEMSDYRDIYTRPKHPYTQALLSAVPVPDLNAKSKRIILGGDVPSPINPPTGCRFHPRCPHRMDICPREEPQLKNLGDDHWVACHLH